MPNFVIAGQVDCPLYVHAIHVAEFLSENLPDIVLSKKEFINEAWTEFLYDINKKNTWYMTKSPVIWKELSYAGSKPYLIGGLSEFWEYIDDYYGIDTFLDRDTVEKLREQNLEAHHLKESLENQERNKSYVISIYGFNNRFSQMLLSQLFNVPVLFDQNPVVVKIYDPESSRNYDVEINLAELIHDFQLNLSCKVNVELQFCTNLLDLVHGADLILITEDYSQHEFEDRTDWLKRCSVDMFELANQVKENSKTSIRIICCHLGPVCFTATCLTMYCEKDMVKNIVAVTAQEGLKVLNSVSKLTDIPLNTLSAPPVWGFIGLDKYVDVHGIIVLREIIRPYKRAIKNIEGSTLPQKAIRKELQLLACNLSMKDIETEMIARCNLYSTLGRQPILPLLRATLHLLELWYSPKKNSDEVISLGIFSTGTFGIPRRIVFSQPVILDHRKIWMPFEALPILGHTREELKECFEFTARLFQTIKDCF